jgi:uncharacterized membrane protein YvbJ
MSQKGMKARYFCENCGVEVRPGASSCPSCGRVFTAVRCPECGFEGRASEFAMGCPSCGFMEQKKADPLPSRLVEKRNRRSFSARFYRIAGIVLLALAVILVALILLRP